MARWLLASMVALLAAPLAGQPVIDYGREERWAQEVVPAIVEGEAVWLATPSRPKVLAILTTPAEALRGGVIVIHGLGVHPDYGLVSGVRTGLAEAGYTTLSVQMPVLPAGATRDDYRVSIFGAGDRIAAAIALLRHKGVARIAIVSHSLGATMVDAYLARTDASTVDAWVPVGMLVDFATPPKEPVLDVMAESDLIQVAVAAQMRLPRLPHDLCSRQLTIAGTDHTFENRQKELTAAIDAFLQKVFGGHC
jgi:alpha/beta superfamily hydrolase